MAPLIATEVARKSIGASLDVEYVHNISSLRRSAQKGDTSALTI